MYGWLDLATFPGSAQVFWGQSVIGFAWGTSPKSIFTVSVNIRSALIRNGQESDDVPEFRTR